MVAEPSFLLHGIVGVSMGASPSPVAAAALPAGVVVAPSVLLTLEVGTASSLVLFFFLEDMSVGTLCVQKVGPYH